MDTVVAVTLHVVALEAEAHQDAANGNVALAKAKVEEAARLVALLASGAFAH